MSTEPLVANTPMSGLVHALAEGRATPVVLTTTYQLRIGQLVTNAAARHRATIVQQKTHKPVQFELTDQTRESLIVRLTSS